MNLIKEYFVKFMPTSIKKPINREIKRLKSYRESALINRFNYRNDDVIIVSYPKSGSTWLRFICAHLIKNKFQSNDIEIDFQSLNRIIPAISYDAINKANVDFDSLPSPRILRSHSLFTNRFPKVVYLLRDGRDVMVSYYYHFKKLHDYKGTLCEFIKEDKIRQVEWSEHVNAWLYNNKVTNMYIIKYEDMIDNTFREIKKLTEFIKINVTTNQIQKAIENSDFKKMRKIENQKGLGYIKNINPNIHLVRKGGYGNWKGEFGDKEKFYFRKKYGKELIKTGYE